MQNHIKPPVLISRLMAVVLATALVVLGALGWTLYRMFPLNRPEIFFLTTEIRANQDVRLVQMQPASENLDLYKNAFVREYLIHRNEVFSNANAMQKKWNAIDGAVRIMSDDNVYRDFAQTDMFVAMMSGMPDFNFRCPVNFIEGPTYLPSEDMYKVKIQYFCDDNISGQTVKKEYTIKLKLSMEDNTEIRWADKIENPLGLWVSEYKIIEGDGDPLDTGFREAE